MTSTAYDDQFAECTPEEEEAFKAIEARQNECASGSAVSGQRERFEAWAVKPPRNWWSARADENHKYLAEGEYLDEGVQRAWEGWQAAAPKPEGTCKSPG